MSWKRDQGFVRLESCCTLQHITLVACACYADARRCCWPHSRLALLRCGPARSRLIAALNEWKPHIRSSPISDANAQALNVFRVLVDVNGTPLYQALSAWAWNKFARRGDALGDGTLRQPAALMMIVRQRSRYSWAGQDYMDDDTPPDPQP